jgi:hypothetical protein
VTAAACLAYTAAEGWHLAEVDLDLIVQCERDALRPARPRPSGPAACGTPGGYQRHRRNGEEVCGPCREARRVDQQDRRALRTRQTVTA